VTEPFRGAPHTVRHIKRVALEAQADYQVRLLAEDIVGRLGNKDYLSEILAIYHWVCANTRYANDPRTVELVRSPGELLDRLLENARALRAIWANAANANATKWRPSLDCDDLTALLAALFLSMGREVRIVTVAFKNMYYNGKRQYQHVYLQVREPRTMQWVIVDPVAAESTNQMLKRITAVKIWPIA